MKGVSMKRIIGVLMLLLTVLIVGCSTESVEKEEVQKEENNVKEAQDEVTEGEVIEIGIVQIVEHPSLDATREGIINKLAEEGYVDGENIAIDYKNAQNDQTNLNTITRGFVEREKDLIIAIATPSAQSAAAATSDIPIIFSAVTDAEAANLVASNEAPGGNVTGTSDIIPLEDMFGLMEQLTPDIESIGFLYTASEINSKVVVDAAKEIAEAKGLAYEEVTVTNSSEVKQGAESLIKKVDAIYTPTDNTIASAMPVLAEVGRSAKKPIYVGADELVKDGGYATIGMNYTDLGAKTAEMVIEVLEGGDPATMPVQSLDQFNVIINKTTADMIELPSDIEGAIIVE